MSFAAKGMQPKESQLFIRLAPLTCDVKHIAYRCILNCIYTLESGTEVRSRLIMFLKKTNQDIPIATPLLISTFLTAGKEYKEY